MKGLIFLAALAVSYPALAHDVGCDGKPIPKNIKTTCCGKSDYHRLSYDQIKEDDKGYVVEDGGHVFHVPYAKATPSPDGCPAIFYSPTATDPAIYCFLIPLDL